MSSGRPPSLAARAALVRSAVSKKRSRPGMPLPLSSRNRVAASRLARKTGASPPVARWATWSMPMNAVFGIRPGMGTSRERKRGGGAQSVQELGRERPLARRGPGRAETDGPILSHLYDQLSTGTLDRDPTSGQAVSHRRRRDGAGGRAGGQREAGTALPDPDLDAIPRPHARELDVGAVG